MIRPVVVLASLFVAASAAAQVKTAPKKPSGPVGPIVTGRSSTARAVSPPAPTPKVTGPSAAATKPPALPPTTVAAKPAPAPVTAATKAPPAAVATVPTKPVPTPAAPATGNAAAAAAAATKTSPPSPTAAAPPAPVTAQAAASVPNAADAATAGGASVTIEREVFGYERGARRDPFTSLLQSEDLRPAIADLHLVGVVLDQRGRNSIAVLRDITTKEQYRLRTGQTIGRLRVTQIQQRSVTFVIEEFGVSRQQVLSIRDSTRVRTP